MMIPLIGGLYAAAVYAVLRRSIVRLVVGFLLLSHANNLLIFTAGGLVRGAPPIAPQAAHALSPPFADPLPQALILTAIVINFGVFAFLLVLMHRAYKRVGTDDLDEMRGTDR